MTNKRKKRIAILVGHRTAHEGYCQLFHRLGFDTYIPLFDNVGEKVSSDSVRSTRTINDASILDDFNFYSNHNEDKYLKERDKVRDVYEYLLDNFDYVLTYHYINPLLNQLLTDGVDGQKLKSYFLLWGDVSPGIWQHYGVDAPWFKRWTYVAREEILNSSSADFLLCHDFLQAICNEKLPTLPIPVPDISEYEDVWSPEGNQICIIQSRLNRPHNARRLQWLERLASRFSSGLPNIKINICGKENSVLKNSQHNPLGGYKNIEIHEPDKKHGVYEIMKSSRLLIWTPPIDANGDLVTQILQYSVIEASCIGIPIIYPRNSALDIITQRSSHPCVTTPSNFSYYEPSPLGPIVPIVDGFEEEGIPNVLSITKKLMNTDINDLERSMSYQKTVYRTYDIDNLLESYRSVFK